MTWGKRFGYKRGHDWESHHWKPTAGGGYHGGLGHCRFCRRVIPRDHLRGVEADIAAQVHVGTCVDEDGCRDRCERLGYPWGSFEPPKPCSRCGATGVELTQRHSRIVCSDHESCRQRCLEQNR